MAARRVAGADDEEAEAVAEAAVDSDEASALSSLTVARRDDGRDDGREGDATGEDSCLGVSCGTRLWRTKAGAARCIWRVCVNGSDRDRVLQNRGSDSDSRIRVSYQECRLRASSRRSGPLAAASFCEAIIY